MKLNPNFIIHNHPGGTVMMPTSQAAFSGVVQGNRTLADIFDLLRADTTEEAIVRALREKYAGAEEEMVRADVARGLAELRAIGALEE